MRLCLALLVFVALGGSASAQESMRIALDLGTVIGSEKGCGLSFDQAAIEDFIEAKVPATDMEFMTTMNMSASVADDELSGFSASQKTAHCAQVRRVAQANGFLK